MVFQQLQQVEVGKNSNNKNVLSKEEKMRIWLQSADAFGDNPLFVPYQKALMKRAKEVARPETTVDVYGVEVCATGLDRSRYLEFLNTPQVIENAIMAERENYDAFAMTCMLDPGYYELREVLTIPVVMPLEANCHIACLLAPKFALVAHNDILLRRQTNYVKQLGLGDRLVFSSAFNVSLPTLQKGFVDPEPVVSEVKKIAIKAAENGADMLISLCGNLTMILVSHGITEIGGIPFMDSVATAIKAAELLVDLKKIGIDRVKHGLFTRPNKEEIAAARKLYGVE